MCDVLCCPNVQLCQCTSPLVYPYLACGDRNQAKAAIRNAAQHKIPLSSDYIIAAQLPMTVGDLPLPIPGPSGDGSAVLAPPPPSAL